MPVVKCVLLRRNLLLLVDLIAVCAASVVALSLREDFEVSSDKWRSFSSYVAIVLAVTPIVLITFRLNRGAWQFSGLNDYLWAGQAAIVIVTIAVALAFSVFRLDGIARSLPVLQAFFIAAGLVGVRVGARLWHRRRQRHVGVAQVTLSSADEAVLVVGWGSLVELYLRTCAELKGNAVHVVGVLSPDARDIGSTLHGAAVLGTPADVSSILAGLDVHGIEVGRIVIAMRFDGLPVEARKALLELEARTTTRLHFLTDVFGISESAAERINHRSGRGAAKGEAATSLDKLALGQILTRSYWRFKRLADATIALVLLILLLPIMMAVAILVAVDVGAPILFIQQRPGRTGVRFDLYKFRTMGAAHDGAGDRIPDDARVSPVGRFLRRTHLDELPQLFNILIGDMSFVGPRPLVAKEQAPELTARLLVRPGLTGWAQVRGGRDIDLADKVALDVWYIRHASFRLDLRIAASTAALMLFGERVDGEAVRQAWSELGALGVYKSGNAVLPPTAPAFAGCREGIVMA